MEDEKPLCGVILLTKTDLKRLLKSGQSLTVTFNVPVTKAMIKRKQGK